MAVPLLTPLPQPPLPTDAEEVFDARAGATLAAQKVMVDEMNVGVIPAINSTAALIELLLEDTQEAADAASLSASTAATQAQLATTNGQAQVDLAADQVGLAVAQVTLAELEADHARISAINAANSAAAAESAPGSIGNLALLQATALIF